jgi:hypothetical protein
MTTTSDQPLSVVATSDNAADTLHTPGQPPSLTPVATSDNPPTTFRAPLPAVPLATTGVLSSAIVAGAAYQAVGVMGAVLAGGGIVVAAAVAAAAKTWRRKRVGRLGLGSSRRGGLLGGGRSGGRAAAMGGLGGRRRVAPLGRLRSAVAAGMRSTPRSAGRVARATAAASRPTRSGKVARRAGALGALAGVAASPLAAGRAARDAARRRRAAAHKLDRARRATPRTATQPTPAQRRPSVAAKVRPQAGTQTPSPRPGRTATPGRPVRAARPSTTGARGAHMALGLVEMAAQLRAAAERYEPANMQEYERDIPAALAPAMADLAGAVRALQGKAIGELPVHSAYAESLAAVARLLASAAEQAQDAAPAFRAMHEPERTRYESPRTGEQLWDVGRS